MTTHKRSRSDSSSISRSRSRLPSQPTVRYLLHRYRRFFASGLGTVALLAAMAAARPAPEPTIQVVTATRAIEAGHTLTQDDLGVAPWPSRLKATESYFSSANDAVGRMTAGPVAEGEPLHAGRIVGPSLLGGSELETQDQVATIVRLADRANLALARPGDYVDILAADSQTIGDFERESGTSGGDSTETKTHEQLLPSASTLVQGARVLAIPGIDSESGIGTAIGLQSQNTESVVVLAVSQSTASVLAGAQAKYRLSMVVNPNQLASKN